MQPAQMSERLRLRQPARQTDKQGNVVGTRPGEVPQRACFGDVTGDKVELDSQEARACRELAGQDAMRIKVSGDQLDVLHQIWFSGGDGLERAKEVISKPAWRGDDAHLRLPTQAVGQFSLDVAGQDLQPVMNGAVQRVAEKNALERAPRNLAVLVDDAHDAGGISLLHELASHR